MDEDELRGARPASLLTLCVGCGGWVDPRLGQELGAHRASGSMDDPLAPGEWSNVCRSCERKGVRGSPC